MNDIYRYDPERCEFVRVPRGFRYYAGRLLPYVVIAVASGALFLYGFYALYDSPTARTLKLQQNQLTAAITDFDNRIDTLSNTVSQLQRRDTTLYRSINNADPLPVEDDKLAAQAPKDTTSEKVDIGTMQQRVEQLSRKLAAESQTHSAMVQLAREKKKELSYIPSIRPVPTEIISGFGQRKHPIIKKDRQHNGIDFKADMGTKVVATADGVVTYVGTSSNGLGLMIVLDHANGYTTRYGHLNQSAVYVGKRVKRGDVIALSGNSGLSKGPHLYYQIDKDGKAIDPIDFFFNDLKPEELLIFRKKASQYNESMS
jgi:murein DD-endopeptidase MepM/ murein hydrolase activator NlpD